VKKIQVLEVFPFGLLYPEMKSLCSFEKRVTVYNLTQHRTP